MRGFLLAHHAPNEVLAALEGLQPRGRVQMAIAPPVIPGFDAVPAKNGSIEIRNGDEPSRIVTEAEVACLLGTDAADTQPRRRRGSSERIAGHRLEGVRALTIAGKTDDELAEHFRVGKSGSKSSALIMA